MTNATTGADIRTLDDNDTLSRAQLPAEFSIRAYTDPSVVGSVVFTVNGARFNVEENAPYDLDGGTTTIPNPWVTTDGNYAIAAQAFSDGDASGTAGDVATIHVDVTE